MKSIGIPYCYYPTTTIFVDDDERFLSLLNEVMDTPYKSFTNPYEAIRFLLSSAVFSSLEKSCFIDEGTPDDNKAYLSVDVTPIYQQIYNPIRFDEISVLVVDYQMPSMNGVEFCKSIRDKNFKIVMLTGEATHELAVSAFNSGMIDAFVQKSTPQLYRKLSQVISSLQFKHFQDISGYMIHSFANGGRPLARFLQNDSFAFFFKEMLKKYQISEYYLLNNLGDFLVIHSGGKIGYFMVRDELSFNEFVKFEVEPEYLSEPFPEAKALFESIKQKEKIPFLWGLSQKTFPEFEHWPLYPVQSELCEGTLFYYSMIEKDPLDRGLDASKISFLKQQ